MDIARITPNNQLIMNEDSHGHIVLVPSIHLSFFQLSLPAKSIAQCQRIIAFSLEEELAEDIANLHYSMQRKDEQWFVVVCAHQKMQQWLSLCNENNINPKKLIPDVLALPEESDFLIEPEQCLLRIAEQLPIAIHPNIIEEVVKLLPEDTPELNPFTADNYEELLESDLQIDSTKINLLQNEYSRTTPYTSLLKPWLKVALWGGILWMSFTAYLYLDNQQMQANIDNIKQYNTTQFKKLFPEETRIVNLRTQAEQKFRQITQQQQIYRINFIGLSEDVIQALQQHATVNISQVNYRKYALQLYLVSNSVAAIQGLINQLKQNPKLTIKVQSLGENNGKAKSTLNIQKVT